MWVDSEYQVGLPTAVIAELNHVGELLLRDRGAAGQPPLRDGVHATGKGHTQG